ncbi:hypothetical protein CPC735_011280 [Coccidioides posadasii C735 delta SOWgp]|uniref:Uncharacterized protein n=1 Tax=Coccidioides posadasii (strain C735) TaxID=222929 RepID=C5NZB7_COCP7|nr:hypothetical protein CPC735_011280 [Coccidioides posadasii C735 delta SOWgp]EER29810.1 hypothetical protein CPC735_011280 [Coccidioides posadasii C735 delta SOWgp]|eukprot:XP_003071955.1 hypothetical protein CPC735_011280 [Coccidioides posadasii C735 delta SOWgp]
MKLVLDISIMTGLNYFDLIDVSDCSVSAAPVSAVTICCLYSAPTSLTTSAAAPPSLSLPTTTSLSFSGTDRVSACQMVGIRAPVWFTKLVLEEQEEKKKKKKEKKKEKENNNNNKNDDNDKNDNNDENDELAI